MPCWRSYWGLSFMVLVRVVAAFGWAGTGAACARSTAGRRRCGWWRWLMRRKLDFSCGWRPLAIAGFPTVVMQLAGIAYAAAPRIGTAMTAIIVSAIPLFTMVVGASPGSSGSPRAASSGSSWASPGSCCSSAFPTQPLTPAFLLSCADLHRRLLLGRPAAASM